jgi:signal transduction histidine kinase
VALAIASTIRRLLARIPLKARTNSLAARLILAAAVWSSLALAVGGLVISNAFRSAVADNFDASLATDLDGMIAAAEPDPEGGVALQNRFLNTRFSRVYSGLYWQIVPEEKGGEIEISRSLFDRTLKLADAVTSGKLTWGYADGPENQRLRVLARKIKFSDETTPPPNDYRQYTFMVAGDLSVVDNEIAAFNGTLIRSFLALLAGLIVAVLLQVRVGLQPLRKVGEALARIRSGASRRLEGEFPAEIAPLAAELNSLIEHSAEVVGRARTHVSNLAHYLKTPLSVLTSEADTSPGALAEAVKKQVEVMRRQVDHYLARARAAGALDVLGNRTQVRPVLEDLKRVLEVIHEARGIEVAVDCPAALLFRGERQDLEEMAGNLMDNACKWARARVVASAAKHGGWFTLAIEDDGRGLPPEDRARAMARGERLDESVPGSGLGLAIVRDIAKLYGGELDLAESGLGGLKAVLKLPAIG